MRKIESMMLQAIQYRYNFRKENTSVLITPTHAAVYLHNNHIADVMYDSGEVAVNKEMLSRWSTPTTKSRLRALGANVTTRKGVTYLNNEAV